MVRQRFLGGTYGKDLGGGRDGFYNTLVVDDKARRSHWTIVWVVRMRHPEHLQDLDLKKNEERKKGKKEKRKKGRRKKCGRCRKQQPPRESQLLLAIQILYARDLDFMAR